MTTFDTPKTPAAFVETCLRTCVEADLLASENINDRWLREAHTHTAVMAFVATTAMETLRHHAPEAADALAEHLDRVITAGDLGGPAYRTAKGLAHDPDQWIAAHEERAALRKVAS